MNTFYNRVLIILGALFIAINANAQVLINEAASEVYQSYVDENGDEQDWIELYNAGATAVDLENYTLTDSVTFPNKLIFPSVVLQPGEFLTVFASGENYIDRIDHWETVVASEDTWQYLIPTAEPASNWRTNAFNASSWATGQGGFGYADGDDNTVVDLDGGVSIFLRKEFIVTDSSQIKDLIFSMDYDDGFVAYLNGVKIASGNMGSDVAFDAEADGSHDAMVEGGVMEDFDVDPALIVNGVNVLAVQVHNVDAASSDLSGRPYLSAGVSSANLLYATVQPWLVTPTSGTLIHTSFSLDNKGETITLYTPSGSVADQVILPELHDDISYGRVTDGGASWTFFSPSTPNESNGSGESFNGIWEDNLIMSVPSGFYASAQSVVMSCQDPQSSIRYTTDGTKPTASSNAYSGSVSVSSTTSLRAACFRSGYVTKNSKIETNTYFIGDSHTLPVVSLSTDPEGFFSDETGIYVKGAPGTYNPSEPYEGANFRENWEREVHFEYFDENKVEQVEQDLGVKIFGAYSRAWDMKSLRLIARKQYGDSKIKHQFFKEKSFIDEYDQLVLRNAGNDYNRAQMRDGVNHLVLGEDTENDYMAFQPVVVYLNGEYWGVHNLRERINPEYVEANHGIDHKDIEFLEFNADPSLEEVKQGSNTHYLETIDFALNNDISNQANYEQLKTRLDIPNVIDYIIAQAYHNNWDWPHNNIRYWRDANNGKWRYFYYDTDFGLDLFGGYGGRTDASNNELARVLTYPTSTGQGYKDNIHSELFIALFDNSAFRCDYANRAADLYNTIYTPDNFKGIVDSVKALMAPEMPDHFDKWGSSSFTWDAEINDIKSFIDDRPSYARDYVESELGLTGQFTFEVNVQPAGAGKIRVSTVVPDTYPWTGEYFGGCPVKIEAIANDGYAFTNWSSSDYSVNQTASAISINFNTSGSLQANFVVTNQVGKLAISELNYNSPDTLDAGDWVELHNYGNKELDISGWVFKDENDFNQFVIPQGTVLQADEYLVLSRNLIAFAAIHPEVTNVIGEFDFKLSNGGERIRMFNAFDELKIDFVYDDAYPWSDIPDGNGGTLELIDPDGDLSDAANWFFGCLGGSPGKAYEDCPCESPYLGTDKYLCESPSGYTLSSGVDAFGTEFTWYKDGIEIFGANTANYNAVLPGTYRVIANQSGCIKEDEVSIKSNVEIDLGDDISLCETSSVTLNAGIVDPSVSFEWVLSGNTVSTSSSYLATQSGTYTLKAKLASCSEVSDNVTVSTAGPNPVDQTKCSGGSFDLAVTGNGNYAWYDQEIGGTQVETGKNYTTPNLSNTTTYYVDDADYYGFEIGPKNYDIGDSWGADNWDWQLKFEVMQTLYLNYVTVFPEAGTSVVVVNIYDDSGTGGTAGNLVKQVTVNATSSEQRVYLGAQLSPGKYLMTGEGTNGELRMNGDNGGAFYPYEQSGYLSIYRTQPDWAGNQEWYPYFYNFEISNSPVQEKCARIPVTAYTCETPDFDISLSTSNVEIGEIITVTPSIPEDVIAVDYDFGEGAEPRYVSGTESKQVKYLTEGSKTITVTVVTAEGEFTETYTNVVTVCSDPYGQTITASEYEFCGNTVYLTADLLSGYDYQWHKDGADLTSATIEDNEYEASETGSYSATIFHPTNPSKCKRTLDAVQITDCVLSVAIVDEDGLDVFPNPVQDKLSITGLKMGAKLEVMSADGHVIYQGDALDYFDMQDFDPGLYLLQIHQGDEVITKRIVKL